MIAICLAYAVIELPHVQVLNRIPGETIKVLCDAGKFTAIIENQQFDIKSYNVHGCPKEITNKQLQDNFWFQFRQNGADSILKAHGRLLGGEKKKWWQALLDWIGPIIVEFKY